MILAKSPPNIEMVIVKKFRIYGKQRFGTRFLTSMGQKRFPTEYKKIIREDLTNLIKASLNQTDYDIAKVVHRMLKHEFVCVSSKSQLWYQFKNHRWVEIDNATELRRKISEDVSKEYTNLGLHCNSQLIGSIDDDGYDEMVNQEKH